MDIITVTKHFEFNKNCHGIERKNKNKIWRYSASKAETAYIGASNMMVLKHNI